MIQLQLGRKVFNVVLCAYACSASSVGVSPLPGLITYSWQKLNQTSLTGTGATECSHAAGDNTPEAAIFFDVALYTKKSQNNCWTSADYSHQNYELEIGNFSSSCDQGISTYAYQISEPKQQATNFGASDIELYYRPRKPGTLKIYDVENGEVNLQATIDIASANVDKFISTGLHPSKQIKAVKYVFDMDGLRFSKWPIISDPTEGAFLATRPGYSLSARRFQVGGAPYSPETHGKNTGPSLHAATYGWPKKFFACRRSSDAAEGVVWQDQSTMKVYMTWISSNLMTATTTDLNAGGNFWLAAAACNNNNHIILVTVSKDESSDKYKHIVAKAYKIDATTGATVLTKDLPTQKDNPGMNIHKFGSTGASMVWNTQTNKLCLNIARTMTRGDDNLNHQGAIAIIIDAVTLDMTKNFGQTSGHSFANSMILASDGTFLGMDLGDNYPRGVHMWRFSDAQSLGKFVVYTFKTKHQEQAGGKEVYTEISTSGKTYYKWSNDNYVYTEIAHAGLVEVDDGILTFFAGEKPPLDNSKVGSAMNAPRNFGLVKVHADLTSKTILSPGATETGGFYNYGGGWSAQENKGVNFLTSFASMDQSVCRPKTVKLGDDSILLTWEIWTPTKYVRSYGMVVDNNGAITTEAFDLGYSMMLPFADDLVYLNSTGRVIAYAGAANGILTRYEICIGTSCPTKPKNSELCGGAATQTQTPAQSPTNQPNPNPTQGLVPNKGQATNSSHQCTLSLSFLLGVMLLSLF